MIYSSASSPKQGFLFRLSPVTKLFLGAVIITAGFLTPGLPNMGILGVVCLLPLICSAGILTRYSIVLSGLFVPFCFFVFLVYTFFMPVLPGNADKFWTISINHDGFLRACILAQQVLVLMAILVLIMMTTSPPALVRDLQRKGCPPMICYILLASLYLIPQLREQATAILQAQKARGLDVEGNLVTRIKAFLPLLSPLVFGLLAKTEERAAALEVKGFNLACPKTSIKEYSEKQWEPVVHLTCVLLLMIIAGTKIWHLLH